MTSGTPPVIENRVILDIDRCVGCRSCSAACFYSHQALPGVRYGVVREGTLPVICRQCEDPACVEACPVDALRREENGVVRRSSFLCIGCKSCVYACPFGVIHPDLTRHLAGKCDLCAERVVEGGIPRCVATCPSGALRFESGESLDKNRLLLLGGRMSGEHPFRRR